MKAAQLMAYGGEDSIVINDNVAKPNIGKDEILVRVEAFGINPFDGKVRQGYMQEMIPLSLPATLGSDLSGIIDSIGEEVEDFEVGEQVFGAANSVGGNGSYAEYSPVKASQLAKKPKGLEDTIAAGIPLAGASAYQAIYEHLELKSGQKILIHGGAGGIGSFAIQLAKNIGAYVATTVSGDSFELAKSLGADQVIDYKKTDFTQVIKDFDAVLDTIGGDTGIKSYQVLKSGGKLVSLWNQPDQELMKVNQVEAVYQFTSPSADKLTALAELVSAGKIKVIIDSTYKFDETAKALEKVVSGHPRGKVVVSLR